MISTTPVVALVANHLWQSTLFAALMALLSLALRRNRARARYWLWLTASLKFLVPFSLLVALGSHLPRPQTSQVSKAGIYTAIARTAEPFTHLSRPALQITTALVPSRHSVAQSTLHSLTSPTPATIGQSTTMQTVAALPVHPREGQALQVLPILAAVWLVGLAIVCTLWGLRWRRISEAVHASVLLQEGREADLLRRVELRLKLQRPIKLLVSPALLEPGTFGIVRPALLWPEGVSDHLDDDQLAAVLAHEACHIRWRDNFTSSLHMLVEALFWFHPLVWWLESRLIEERERACDEEVLLLGSQSDVYAESILKVCAFCIASPLVCVSGVTGANLKKRIGHIMSKRSALKLDLARKGLLLTAGSAVIAMPVLFGQASGSFSVARPLAALIQPIHSPSVVPVLTPRVLPAVQAISQEPAGLRTLVIFFDLDSMQPQDLGRAVSVARTFVDTRMQAENRISLVSLGRGLNVDQDFTSDKALLHKALDRYTATKIVSTANGDDRPNASVERSASALKAVGRSLSAMQQKKIVLYFSGGPINQEGLRPAVEALAQSNISVYFADARGMYTQATLTQNDGQSAAGSQSVASHSDSTTPSISDFFLNGLLLNGWRTLQRLNPDIPYSQQPAEVLALNEKRFTIPGFMVPLVDHPGDSVNEFLLVPFADANIHLPAPPANQMIYVRTRKNIPVSTNAPVVVLGRLHISHVVSPYGEVSFDMAEAEVFPLSEQQQLTLIQRTVPLAYPPEGRPFSVSTTTPATADVNGVVMGAGPGSRGVALLPVTGARLSLVNVKTDFVFQTVVDKDGAYHLHGLPPGEYIFNWQADGFYDAHAGAYQLDGGKDTGWNFTMARTPTAQAIASKPNLNR